MNNKLKRLMKKMSDKNKNAQKRFASLVKKKMEKRNRLKGIEEKPKTLFDLENGPIGSEDIRNWNNVSFPEYKQNGEKIES